MCVDHVTSFTLNMSQQSALLLKTIEMPIGYLFTFGLLQKNINIKTITMNQIIKCMH